MDPKHRQRELRRHQTRPESLLWRLLRDRRLCGLKFRRQHSVGPFVVDFACVELKLVVELDGDYHDKTGEKDVSRQRAIELRGWTVLRFTNEDVVTDLDGVGVAIARHSGIAPTYRGKPLRN